MLRTTEKTEQNKVVLTSAGMYGHCSTCNKGTRLYEMSGVLRCKPCHIQKARDLQAFLDAERKAIGA